MTNKEKLKIALDDAKETLERDGFFLGKESDNFMSLIPAMKKYEYAFQSCIENIWPDDPWWKHTDYWDIFSESIFKGKTADEVIEDILNHISDDEAIDEELLSEEDLDDSESEDRSYSKLALGDKVKIYDMPEPWNGLHGVIDWLDPEDSDELAPIVVNVDFPAGDEIKTIQQIFDRKNIIKEGE